jgi:hypothetical protein
LETRSLQPYSGENEGLTQYNWSSHKEDIKHRNRQVQRKMTCNEGMRRPQMVKVEMGGTPKTAANHRCWRESGRKPASHTFDLGLLASRTMGE